MNKEVVPACDIKHKDSIEGLACELIRMEATTSERINASIGYCAEWLRQRGLTITLLENQGLMSLVCIVNEERGSYYYTKRTCRCCVHLPRKISALGLKKGSYLGEEAMICWVPLPQ